VTSLVVVVGVAELRDGGQEPADLAGAEADQLAVMIMPLDWASAGRASPVPAATI
jgi:hypothetical protein